MMEVAVLENLQREDLTSLEEAEAYDMLMKKLKLTQEEVAVRLGKSRPYIANYLRLLGLPEIVKQMLQANDISMGQARTLLGLKDKKQIVKLAKKVRKENLTVRQLEQLVNKMNHQKEEVEKLEKTIKKPYYIRESEERLMDKFGTSVIIREKDQKGKIEIEYLSTEDLTRILDVLDIQFDEK
jgi:ParB family chromosome partitioning protein